MGIGATMYRIQVELSDVDRGVYRPLDLRIARHPSETARFMLARALAFCLCWEEGIAFGRGLSTQDEPAVFVRALDGVMRLWIDVGTPSAERLHKASKAVPRVVVFTHHAPALLAREVRGKAIHAIEKIEVYVLAPEMLDALDEATERNAKWDLVRSAGELYVTVGGAGGRGRTITGTVERVALGGGGE